MVTAVKRIVLWLMSTLTVLVLLFGYHTSTSSASAPGGLSSMAAPASGGTISGSLGSGTASSGSSSSSAPSSSAAARKIRSSSE